jgi:hypothetical protein
MVRGPMIAMVSLDQSHPCVPSELRELLNGVKLLLALDFRDDPPAGVAELVGVVGHWKATLVASTTWSRLPPASAFPTMHSDSPPE